MKYKAAMDEGRFSSEIVPIMIAQRRGDPIPFVKDEHARPDTTMETLSALRPVFKVGGTVTAGNASGINDGASAMLVASEKKAQQLGLKPLVSVKAYAVVGVEPAIMGIGPVPAIQKVLNKAGLSMDDIDLVELNEAFAAQSLAVLSDLPIPDEKVNVNGGAIALGHPIGASGAIILTKLIYEMHRRKKAKYGLVSLCCGGGMGIAMIVEKEK
jgi:acetyl-CoA C-acetyltransferase